MARRSLRNLPLLTVTACGRVADLSSPPDPPSTFQPAETTPCVIFDGPVVTLSATDDARHHPSAAWTPDGVAVTWQVGKSPSTVALRRFRPDLTPTGPERALTTDTRATHPQVLARGGELAVAWTSEADGAARLATLGADGQISTSTLHPGGDRPALYPDLATGPDGAVWALWFGEARGGAQWSVARVTDDVRAKTFGDAQDGGPAALAATPDALWTIWADRSLSIFGQSSVVRLARVDLATGALGAATTLTEAKRHLERTALAMGPQGGIAAWTEYPWARGGWGAWVQPVNAEGAAIGEARLLGAGDGAMVDVDLASDIAVAAWQEPDGASTDIVLEALSPATARPICPAVRVHPTTPGEEARADVHLRDDGRGVIVWHVQTGPRTFRVDGRVFHVEGG